MPTPTVASMIATPVELLMLLHFVVRPPSDKINTNAPKPTAWATSALSKWMPITESPSTIPMPRNNSSAGSPKRAPTRAARMAAIRTTALTSRMASRSITGFLLSVVGVPRASGDEVRIRYARP